MSTSEPSITGLELVPELDLTGAAAALAAGLPDPSILTRLANQFIQAVDGVSPPVSTPTALAGGQPALPTLLPTQPQLAPATAPAVPVHAVAPPVAPHPSGIPGGFPAADWSQQTGGFGFLQEARSIFTPPALPQAPNLPLSTSTLTTDTVIKDAQTALPGTTVPAVPTNIPDSALPQVPGAVLRPDVGMPPSYGFLDQARPIVRIDTVPSLAPVSHDLSAPALSSQSVGIFDVNAIRRDFPILSEQVNGRKLVWLDNAATTQKPQAVIDRLAYFYQHENSNIHRAAHTLAARSTDAYEAARDKVRRFLNAGSTQDIIFVRGATEGINLVAQSWGRRYVQKDDEIIVSHLEHHANIVPWQMLCAEKGARLRVAPVDDSGQIILEEYEKLLTPRTKLVSLTQVSNALGTVTPVAEMTTIAHRHGAKVLIDGAQAVSHLAVDVQAIDCDFYVFSGHKVFAPTGIGVVYGKPEVLAATPPWQGGGNMIADVTFERTLYHPPPFRFEAGTGNIADAVGLGAALDYIERIGMANISRYEHDLLVYGTDALKTIPGLHLVGTAREKASVLSFVLDGFKTEEVGAALSREGIAVRSGHHCAQPILRRFGLEATVRPSLAFYNTCEEIDALVVAVWNLKNGRSPGLT